MKRFVAEPLNSCICGARRANVRRGIEKMRTFLDLFQPLDDFVRDRMYDDVFGQSVAKT